MTEYGTKKGLRFRRKPWFYEYSEMTWINWKPLNTLETPEYPGIFLNILDQNSVSTPVWASRKALTFWTLSSGIVRPT